MGNFLQWNTQYMCAISVETGGIFGAFGPQCLIGLIQDPAVTGVIPTQLRPQYCGATNLQINTTVSCTPVPMANYYEFTFTDLSTSVVSIKQTTAQSVLLNSLSPALVMGHSYSVSVRGFVFNTFSAPGLICNISIMAPISNVTAGFAAPACEGTPLQLTVTYEGGISPITYSWNGPNGFTSNQQNPVVTNPVSGTYQVTVTGGGASGSGSSSTLVTVNPVPVTPVITGDFNFCPNNFATLDAGPGYAGYNWSNGMTTQTANILLPNTYTVVVSNTFGCTASASVEVAPCVSGITPTAVRTIDCGKINLTPNAQIQCDPVAAATHYQWEFRDINTLNLYAGIITVGTAISPGAVVPQLQWNTQYIARVRAEVAGDWGNYGNLCTIGLSEDPAITGVPATELRPNFCGITTPLSTVISCHPVTMANLYEFEFTDIATSAVVTAFAPHIYLSLSSVSPALQMGSTYAVRARGFVFNTWSAVGNACNITIGVAPPANGNRELPTNAENATDNPSVISTTSLTEGMQFSAYPNPFNDKLIFTINSAEGNYVTVYLYDISGHIVLQQNVWNNTTQELEGSDLPAGIYTLMAVDQKGKTERLRIIKTK